MTPLPRLSHMQFLVVGILQGGRLTGREVRERLEAFDVSTRGPAFYQMMARMEDGGLVSGGYRQEIIDGQIIRERHYDLSAEGRRAFESSRDFYSTALRDFGALGDTERVEA